MAPQPKPQILSITPYKGGLSKTSDSNQNIIKLSSNESPLGASPKAIAAYKEAAGSLHRYPDGGATLLRETIGEVYDLDPNRIVCGAGSDEILALLCYAYLNSGDETIYTEHGFLMYAISTHAAGGVPVAVKETNKRANTENILGAVTENTKIVFIANPNNPTGTYVTYDELKDLREKLPQNILLVIDGAYAEYVSLDDYENGKQLADECNNVIMTRTFSKIYGLAALRIGWGYAGADIVDILNRVRGPFNVTSTAITAATEAVKDIEFTAKAKTHNDVWLPWLNKELTNLGLEVTPSVANFVLASFPEGEAQADAANEFLMQQGIIPRLVKNYGLPDCLRITVGLEEENKLVIEALKSFV